MTTTELHALGEGIQNVLSTLNDLLAKARQKEVSVYLEIDRKASTTTDIVNRLQLSEMTQNINISFDKDLPPDKW